MNFLAIQEEIERRMKDVTDEASLAIKTAINMAYQEIWMMANWWFARRRGTFQITAPYKTGSITVTKGSVTITGSATTFTAAMVGRKLKVGDDAVIYKIASFTNTTEVKIETYYKGSSGSGKSYGIYEDTFALADRAVRILQMWQTATPAQVYEWDQREMHEIRPSPSAVGIPRLYALIGQTTSAFYTTGTVSATTGSLTVTGTTTAFTADMVGRLMKISGNDDEYVIASYSSATAITIDTPYTGTSGSGKTIEISPPGIEQVELWSLPNQAMQIQYTYMLRALKLLADGHVPELPQQWHHLLVLGGYYRVMPERELSLGMIKMARDDYYNGITEMKKQHYASEDKLPDFKDNFRGQTLVDDDWWRFQEDGEY